MNPVYIGTSGWVYKGWQKVFYPEDIPAREHLEFYATQFLTVEINATFYRLPTLKMVKGWRDRVPKKFVFAVKGSRYITHIKRLTNLNEALNKFIRRIRPLKEHVGPILWQLPPNFKKDIQTLDKFLAKTPRTLHQAVEFRHPSWYEGTEAFELLRKHNVAHVELSSLRMPMNLTVTSDVIYIRFHGLEGGAWHDYTREELEPWTQHISEQTHAGKTVYAYFNNDLNVRAPANAKMLIKMIAEYSRRAQPRSVAAPRSRN